MDCKRALQDSNGNQEEAIMYLKKKGLALAAKRSDRNASEGLIESYIHTGNKVGVLLEINCETDFVAKNSAFKSLAHNICMHIAATSPLCIAYSDLPKDTVNKEREIARSQCEGKPDSVIEKIIDGKIRKWCQEVCLLEQQYVKNPNQTIKDLVNEAISQMGENIIVQKFVRYQIGQA